MLGVQMATQVVQRGAVGGEADDALLTDQSASSPRVFVAGAKEMSF